MDHKLPKLLYSNDALAPFISPETIEYHYGKHHQTYVDNLNRLVKDTAHENKTLEKIIMSSSGAIFNNAAQVYSHNFYWKSLKPKSKEISSGHLFDQIKKSFGSYDQFKKEFTEASIRQFGSGWCWLVRKSNTNLEIVTTSNAETPILDGLRPLITCDLWEHAYYIDYRNARPKYLNAFWSFVNWEFAESNLE